MDTAAGNKMLLTSTDLKGHSLRKGSVLGQLLPEALTHVVINIIGTQQLLKGLKNQTKTKKPERTLMCVLYEYSIFCGKKTLSFSQVLLACTLVVSPRFWVRM